MSTRAQQFTLSTHTGTSGSVRARQFLLAAHVRLTPVSVPIQARQFVLSTHARIIPRRRVISPNVAIALAFPYRTNQPTEDQT